MPFLLVADLQQYVHRKVASSFSACCMPFVSPAHTRVAYAYGSGSVKAANTWNVFAARGVEASILRCADYALTPTEVHFV